MTKHRINARIDNNQPEIVRALEKIPNLSVQVGHDDILIGYRGKTYWIEIKSPDEANKATGEVFPSKIKDSQKELLKNWKGHYAICINLDQIFKELGIN